MQEHQLAGEAGRRAPSWFLKKGDKRYGPLADRELLLLAERGGLQTDDLLWRPGFTCWKSVHAVCSVASSRSISIAKSASPQDAEYLPKSELSNGPAEIAEAAVVSGAVKPKALERWSTDDLQTAIYSGMLDNVQEHEAERILRERELAPDRKLARRIYNNAAWTFAFSLGTFVIALGIFWLIAIGYRLP
jgi:hypothetical protein